MLVGVMDNSHDESCSFCRARKCALTDQYFRRDGVVDRRLICQDCLDAASEEAIEFDLEFRRQAARARAAA